jgi:hypothetical protein
MFEDSFITSDSRTFSSYKRIEEEVAASEEQAP